MPSKSNLSFDLLVNNLTISMIVFGVSQLAVVVLFCYFPDYPLMWVWLAVDATIIFIIPFLSDDSLKSWKNGSWFKGVAAYFLVQYLGSALILCGICLNNMNVLLLENKIGSYFLCVGCGMKLGLFPFHSWVPRSFSQFHYMGIFIVGSAQKIFIIATMPFFSNDPICTNASQFMALGSLLCGSIGMMLSIEVKPFLAYMSVSYSGLLSLCADYNLSMAYQYAAVYCMSTFLLNLILLKSDCEYISDLGAKVPSWCKVGFCCLVISLSGFPPFLDFSMKYAMVQLLWKVNLDFAVFILLMSSQIGVFAWIRVMLFAVTDMKEALEFKGSIDQNMLNSLCVILSLLSGFSFGMF